MNPTQPANPFAHSGHETGLFPLQESQRREDALREGLRSLAASEGIEFEGGLHIDSNGDFNLVVSNHRGFGPRIAALLNLSGGARTGIFPTRHLLPTNNWCRLNHFAAQSILETVNPRGHA